MARRVARGTMALTEHGLDPAAERTTHRTWWEFLDAHWEVRAAAGFFTVEPEPR